MGLAIGGAPLTIVDGIRNFARAQPTATAVIDGPQSLTYAELHERSNRLAQVLLAAGHAGGQTVAVLLGNRLEYCEVAAGIAKAGLVMVPLNPRMAKAEVDYVVGHSAATALILDDANSAVAASAAREVATTMSIDGQTLGDSYEATLGSATSADPLVPIEELSTFCVAYTSGTTGKPKGVKISHRSRALTFLASALEWNLGVGRRSIAVAPMYHGAGFAFGYSPVHTGGTVSMLRAWDPSALLAMIERDRAQSVFLVPAHAQMLKALGEDHIRSYDLDSLDTLYFNAAALPPFLKSWVIDTFPQAGIHELYGSTEAGIVSNLRPAEAARRAGSVGNPWFMTEVRLVDDGGLAVEPGQPGELFSRSPYLMSGYLDDSQATAACTTEDGFLTSGDIAICDDEGYLYIVDRKKDLIVSGGFNVYPREVEDAMRTHPAVRDVAVIGTAHETWGEQVVSIVVPESGHDVDLASIDAHLRPLIAGYKIPRAVVVMNELPRNASGKVLKRELRTQLTAALPDSTARE